MKETEKDNSLEPLYKLAVKVKEGYHLDKGIVFRTRLDMFGQPREQICLPET